MDANFFDPSEPPVLLAAGGNPADVAEISALLREIQPECTLLQATDCRHVHLLAEHHVPDAVFLVSTPKHMAETCFQLHKHPSTATIPMAVLVRTPNTDFRVQAMDAGADICLPMPPDRIELAAAIRLLVRLKRAVFAARRRDELITALMAERNEELERRQRHAKQTEQRARLQRNLLAQLLEATSDCVFLMDAQFCFLEVNTAFCRFAGKSRAEILDKFDVEVLPEELLPLWHEKIRDVFDSGAQRTETFPFAGRRFDLSLFRMALASGTWGVGGIFRDVTDRVMVQRELEEALEDWQHTADTFSAAVTILTPDHRIRRANRLTRDFYEMPENPPHPYCWEIFHAEREMHPQCPFERARKTLRRETMEIPVRDRLVRITVDPILDVYGNLRGAVHIVDDVTAERQLQEHLERMESQLQQAQKMEAIGQLAGGIAHDFNHLLSVVLAGIESAQTHIEEEHPAAAPLHDVRDAATALTDMTRQLLAFARRQEAQPRAMDAGKHLDSISSLLRRLAGEHVRVDIQKTKGQKYPVFMDPAQLTQTLVNLVTNARDAMHQQGAITLALDEVQMLRAVPGGLGAGHWVRLRIADTGSGIPPEILPHVFEPFFTTKSGMGTGMGLATVWGIVQQNHGFIQVESQPGEGTVFTLHFPWIDTTEEQSRFSDSDTITPPPDVKGTILLVEDDPHLLRITSRILADLGYRVLTAGSIAHALAVASANAESIQVLITDISLPEVSGIELAQRIRQNAPDLPVLLMSGHNAEAVDLLLEKNALPQAYFLPKPFTRAALVRKLGEALGNAKTVL